MRPAIKNAGGGVDRLFLSCIIRLPLARSFKLILAQATDLIEQIKNKRLLSEMSFCRMRISVETTSS